MQVKNSIAERLCSVINKLGMSQRRFAKELRMSASMINGQVHGNTEIQPQQYLLMEKVFGISEDFLKHGEGNMFTEEFCSTTEHEKEEKEGGEVCEPSANYGSRSLEEEVYEIKGKVELLTRLFAERGNFAA